MGALHILNGKGEHHQQCTFVFLRIEPVLDLSGLVAVAVAGAAADTDGRVLVRIGVEIPCGRQVILVDVVAAHLVTTARVGSVGGDDGVRCRVAAALDADGCRVVVRRTVLALRVRMLRVTQRVEIQITHGGCPGLVVVTLPETKSSITSSTISAL